ncbi:pirin family protein [Priestia megaterium]|uniref:pirin family protein n=1 Tax=Priestia megaterium TaxID=1404 RepID=UPI002E22E7D8|nr:pirin family protein [Priestia megaterium]
MNILRSYQAMSNGSTSFNLQIKRPGMIWQDFDRDDFAFGPLSRIDHAMVSEGVVVPMHEHVNDEILTYIWKGEVHHKDSVGITEVISSSKLMMMNAGRSFFHEESIPKGSVESLQIFIRPTSENLEPKVQFFDTNNNNDDWKLIAGPIESNAPLELRQNVVVYDVHGKKGDILEIPQIKQLTPWLYIMDGKLKVGEHLLEKGDAITGDEGELQNLELLEDTTLVLFLVDLNAEMTYEGNFSGWKR